MKKAYIGLDMGTQGVRGVLITEEGQLLDRWSESFRQVDLATLPGQHEQSPGDWWRAARQVLQKLTANPVEVAGLAIDGTSGTCLPLDRKNEPLMHAIMYHDRRAQAQAARIGTVAALHEQKHGYRITATYALPKMLWCLDQGLPVERFVHQTDYIVGKLTGCYDVTDWSNALKSCYDLLEDCWPSFVKALIPEAKLPKVVPSGTVIAGISPAGAAETGLRAGTPVCAGATDGCASALAAGAVRPGDWATTIGSTMILKGVTETLLPDPNGVIYSHKHPQGWWMPGGASNAGGLCLNAWFGLDRLDELNGQAEGLPPTGHLVYPLLSPGERFPFVSSSFSGFSTIPQGTPEPERYLATLEGVGYVERLCYEKLARTGAQVGPEICATGGACRSRVWLQTRANILGKRIRVPSHPDAAVGSAMLAAGSLSFGSLSQAADSMLSTRLILEPQPDRAALYQQLYACFVKECGEYHEYL